MDRNETVLDPDHFRTIGAKGGAVLLEKHGLDYFKKIGAKGGATLVALHGIGHFKEIGSKGGERVKVNAQRNDPDYYRRISLASWAKRRATAEANGTPIGVGRSGSKKAEGAMKQRKPKPVLAPLPPREGPLFIPKTPAQQALEDRWDALVKKKE